MQGTDTWMQDPRFQEFLQSQNHGVIWFKAVPGAGKSVVAARLIDHVQTELEAPVSFSFSAKSLRAIAHHTIHSETGLPNWYLTARSCRQD